MPRFLRKIELLESSSKIPNPKTEQIQYQIWRGNFAINNKLQRVYNHFKTMWSAANFRSKWKRTGEYFPYF